MVLGPGDLKIDPGDEFSYRLNMESWKRARKQESTGKGTCEGKEGKENVRTNEKGQGRGTKGKGMGRETRISTLYYEM